MLHSGGHCGGLVGRQGWQPMALCSWLTLAVTALILNGAPATSQGGHGRMLRQQAPVAPSSEELLLRYFSNVEMVMYMKQYAKNCSHIARFFEYGKSVNKEPLPGLEISSTRGEDDGKPYVKYMANIHGDEPSGRQMLLKFADELCKKYKQDDKVTRIVDTMHMFLLPTLNPDGFTLRKRENRRGVDLNRNFPDPVQHKDRDLRLPRGKEQEETLAIMNFTLSYRFVASLSLHEGALVANYPYDGYSDGSWDIRGVKNPTPDDATFVHLANEYARLHTTMLRNNREFPSGITNGAQWYPLYGGMQDWNYLAGKCMELTIEANIKKFPGQEHLRALYSQNEQCFMDWGLIAAYGGLHGKVISARDNLPLEAEVHVLGVAYNVSSSKHGTFYRPLAPGSYNVLVSRKGFETVQAAVDVPKGNTGVQMEFKLKELGEAAGPSSGQQAGQQQQQQQQVQQQQQQQQQQEKEQQQQPAQQQQQQPVQQQQQPAKEQQSSVVPGASNTGAVSTSTTQTVIATPSAFATTGTGAAGTVDEGSPPKKVWVLRNNANQMPSTLRLAGIVLAQGLAIVIFVAWRRRSTFGAQAQQRGGSMV